MARIVMAQLDFWVGDVAGNTMRMIEAVRDAHARFAPDLVVFPELALTGYPPEDLLWRRGLQIRVQEALERLKREALPVAIVFGYPEYAADGLYNAACIVEGGQVVATYRKHRLPNYSVLTKSATSRLAMPHACMSVGGSDWASPSARTSGVRSRLLRPRRRAPRCS